MWKWVLGLFLGFSVVISPVVASIELIEIKKTTASYSSSVLDLDGLVQIEFGENFRVADWQDLQDYVATGAAVENLSELESAMLTRNGNRFYSGTRQYYIDWSDRLGQTPYDNFLSHDNIGQLHLGSWQLTTPILAVRRGPADALPQVSPEMVQEVTQFWYEDNYALDYENTFPQELLLDLINVGLNIASLKTYLTSSAGPAFDAWVRELQLSVVGAGVVGAFGTAELTTASPAVLLFQNVNFDGFTGMSFDFETLGVSVGDLISVRSGNQTLYQLYGSDIPSSGEAVVSFSGLSGTGDLSIGLYSDDAGKKLALSNFKFAHDRSEFSSGANAVPVVTWWWYLLCMLGVLMVSKLRLKRSC